MGTVFFSLVVSIIGLILLYKLLSHCLKNKNARHTTLFLLSLGTPLWHYAHMAWPETFLITLLIAGLYFLIVRNNYFLAGLMFAIGTSIKYPFILITIVSGFYVLMTTKSYKKVISYFFSTFFVILLLIIYNASIWGSMFKTGQTYYFSKWGNPAAGFAGMLFSPSQGILIFAPLIILAIFGLRTFYSQNRKEFFLFAGIFIAYFSFWAIRGLDWEGGAYSNRYVVPLLPLFSIPLGIAYENRLFKKGYRRKLFLALAVYSLVINALAAIFPAMFINQSPLYFVQILIFKSARILEIISTT